MSGPQRLRALTDSDRAGLERHLTDVARFYPGPPGVELIQDRLDALGVAPDPSWPGIASDLHRAAGDMLREQQAADRAARAERALGPAAVFVRPLSGPARARSGYDQTRIRHLIGRLRVADPDRPAPEAR